MATVRRLYLYIVAAVSLGMVVVGLGSIGGILLEMIFAGGSPLPNVRGSLAQSIAMTLVGLPVWALHWTLAQRSAQRAPAERSATLRRLYLYLACAAFMASAMVIGTDVVQRIVDLGFGRTPQLDAVGLARAFWTLALVLGFWAYHFRVAAQDRAAVGEEGAAATLRRWYAYGFRLVALLILLFGAQDLIRFTLGNLVARGDVIVPGLSAPTSLAATLVATATWLFHTRWTERHLRAADQRSTLRTVAGFIVLAVAVSFTLFDASRTLYYALARLLGVAEPGGVRGELAAVLVNPAATVLVFGTAWWLARRRLADDAARTEAARQAGVRRLYTHLVALIALFTLAAGVVWVLITLSDQLTGARPVQPEAWRDQLSLALTLIIVGLPMWLTHWRPEPPTPERLALSRRMYLFATLLVSVLALLGSAAAFVYRILVVLLQTGTTGAESPAVDIGRALAVSLVAAAVGAYHWWALRADNAEREALASGEELPSPTELTVPSFVVEITGASDDEIREALAHLPPIARYELRASASTDAAS